MAELLITCIKKDSSGNIVSVGIDNEVFDVNTIAKKIWDMENSYFTLAMGIRVKVFALRHPDTNEPYLSTSPNIKLPNSLNFLPKCR